ncbi:MAG: flagellar basal-body MS-ring/collar protein FliF [Pseudomonadota bacterium]
MAELPMTTTLEGPAVPGSDFLKGALGMPVVRQVTLLIAMAASVAAAVYIIFWMQTGEFKPIGGATSAMQTNEIVGVLEGASIEHKIDPKSGMVLVPAQDLYAARMRLAGADVLDGQQLGYELLDEEQGFGVSQFMESAKHRRSVEGELAKSIQTITAVLQARVLLAMPKTTSFLRDRRKPSASVTVTLKPNRRLTSDQVTGVANLVAAAVPELHPNDVVVVDQSGALLSDNQADPSLKQSEKDLALTRRVEDSLHEKVANILSPWVGSERFTAEVSATLDFTRSTEAEELYNPDLVALRSEQTTEEQRVGGAEVLGGVPGTLTNQPPEFNEETPDGQPAPNRTSSVQAVRNYEVDRTLSYTQHQVGQIRRVSVAVVVDDKPVVDAETGETALEPWTQEEIDQIVQAVQSAVGFRADRGDLVSVVNRTFFRAPVEEVEPEPFWSEAWFADLLKQVLGGIALIVIVFGLIRPMFKNLSQAGELVREQQSMAIADMTQAREAALEEAVTGIPAAISTDPNDSAVEKMETVRNLIEDDPARVAQVVKHWVSEEEGV